MGDDGDDERVSETARRLRPLGYVGIGIVWLALTLISLGLWAALPAILPIAAGPLSEAHGIVSLTHDPSNLTAFILSMIILPPFFMYVLLALTAGCASLMLLAFIYAGRAASPRYADKRLSRTAYAADAMGSPLAAFLPKALSLLPSWRSRATDVLAGIVTLAFRPGFRVVMGSWVLGLCYFFTIGWALWPVRGAAVWLFLTGSVVLGAVGVWLVIRSAIARYRKLSAEVNAATDSSAEARP